MTDLQALVERDADGSITRIVRTYESASRASEDRELLQGMNMAEPLSYEIIAVEHID